MVSGLKRKPQTYSILCVEHDLFTFSSAQTGGLQDSVDVIGRSSPLMYVPLEYQGWGNGICQDQ